MKLGIERGRLTMRRRSWTACLLGLLLVGCGGSPGEDPALRPIVDVPGLPRVLLIGDSISVGYTIPVRNLLDGVANVHRIPTNGGPSSRVAANLETWLGTEPWDVIHLNCGLHDVAQTTVGVNDQPLEEYERLLRLIFQRLQTTGATIIWASTTPVPDGARNPLRLNSDVIAYNALAATLAGEFGYRINDLYSFALPYLATWQLPRDVHFLAIGYQGLATQVAASIREALPATESLRGR